MNQKKLIQSITIFGLFIQFLSSCSKHSKYQTFYWPRTTKSSIKTSIWFDITYFFSFQWFRVVTFSKMWCWKWKSCRHKKFVFAINHEIFKTKNEVNLTSFWFVLPLQTKDATIMRWLSMWLLGNWRGELLENLYWTNLL